MTATSCGLAKLSRGSCLLVGIGLSRFTAERSLLFSPSSHSLVRQVVNENATEQFLNMRRRDQQRALGRLREDTGLR